MDGKIKEALLQIEDEEGRLDPEIVVERAEDIEVDEGDPFVVAAGADIVDIPGTVSNQLPRVNGEDDPSQVAH